MHFIQTIRSTGNNKKIIYFPYAGGFSNYFYQFSQLFSHSYDLFSVEYQGRREEQNLSSTCSFQELCNLLANNLFRFRDNDFYFIGVSMGGYIAFKVAQIMETFLKISPKHIFMLSVMDEPNLMISLKDSKLWISKFLNNQILKDDQIFSDYIKKLMLIDRSILMTMQLESSYLTHTPFTIINGEEDSYCHSEVTKRFWKNRTTQKFEYKTHIGGHLPRPSDLQNNFRGF